MLNRESEILANIASHPQIHVTTHLSEEFRIVKFENTYFQTT